MNVSGYNDAKVRIAVISPLEDGWAIAGVHVGWTTRSPLRKFPTLDAAKAFFVLFKSRATRITWIEEA